MVQVDRLKALIDVPEKDVRYFHLGEEVSVVQAQIDTGEELLFRRPGVRDDTLRRLRRGQYSVEAEVDLHGLGRHAAHEALRDFIVSSAARGLSCVRVIHGKGRGSGPRGPVLKHVVNHWLRRMDDVLAFASARPVDGGTGAAYVLLGRQRGLRPARTGAAR